MNKVTLIAADGQVARIEYIAEHEQFVEGAVVNGLTVRFVDLAVPDDELIYRTYWDHDENQFKSRPAKPSEYHRWEYPEWVAVPDQAKASRIAEVDSWLQVKINEPVVVGGILFDGDEVAKARVSGVLARLLRGDGLPSMWSGWRDANNAAHWASDSSASVLENLRALALALEDREQFFIVTAWGHKAAIASLSDVPSILAYVVE